MYQNNKKVKNIGKQLKMDKENNIVGGKMAQKWCISVRGVKKTMTLLHDKMVKEAKWLFYVFNRAL